MNTHNNVMEQFGDSLQNVWVVIEHCKLSVFLQFDFLLLVDKLEPVYTPHQVLPFSDDCFNCFVILKDDNIF